MMKRVLFFIISFVCFCAFATNSAAQCTPVWSESLTDAFAQGTAPTVPAAGSKFCDPVFDTEILRVTDAGTSSSANFSTAYSYWPSFNCDATRVFALRGDGFAVLFDFDADTMTVSNPQVLPSGVPSYEWAVYWSHTDPDIMYGVNGLAIRQMDVSAGTPAWSTIVTYTDTDLGITGATQFQQIHVSDDNNTLSATVKNGGGTAIGIAAVRINATKEVYYAETTSDIDEVQIDKSGRWLVHKTGNQGANIIEVRIIDTTTDTVEDLEDDAPDYAPGHSDNGNGVVVGSDNWRNGITSIPLSNPQSNSTLLIEDGAYAWFQAHHISMRKNGDDWALISFYGSVSTTRFNNEIWFLNTSDGSVRRFVKHYSGSTYGELPRANVSKDGKWVAYTSTYGTARTDLYIARVPAGMGIWPATKARIGGSVRLRGVRL